MYIDVLQVCYDDDDDDDDGAVPSVTKPLADLTREHVRNTHNVIQAYCDDRVRWQHMLQLLGVVLSIDARRQACQCRRFKYMPHQSNCK